MRSFRELDVWKCAMELTNCVYDLVKKFPSEERYALGDQLRRAVVSIPSNIAEGFGRDSHKDFAHFLSQARGSLYEVETQLEIAVMRKFIAASDIPADLMNTISKLIGSLSRRLRASAAPAQSTRHKAQGTSLTVNTEELAVSPEAREQLKRAIEERKAVEQKCREDFIERVKKGTLSKEEANELFRAMGMEEIK